MSSHNPYSEYRKVQFNTADQGGLILMSFDGAIRFCRAAKDCMTDKDNVGKGKWLSKAYDVVAELRKSLRPDVGGEIAESLDKTYAFICRQITLANVLNNPDHLQNALMVLKNLREAWGEIVRKERSKLAMTG